MPRRWLVVLGLIEIFEGLVKVLSLGYLNPAFSVGFCFWVLKRRF